MYNTIIREQHIIDWTEQERLLLSFLVQKYCKTKGGAMPGLEPGTPVREAGALTRNAKGYCL